MTKTYEKASILGSVQQFKIKETETTERVSEISIDILETRKAALLKAITEIESDIAELKKL